MDNNIVKTSTITIEVGLNKENMPAQILWQSSDAPPQYPKQDAKAMLVSFFDRPSEDVLTMNLWATDMQVHEMDKLMFFTLREMGNAYFKATGNRELAESMQNFVQYFGEKTEILKPTQSK
jgi:gliding motility-associated protein GldC